MTHNDAELMQRAIALAVQSAHGGGGPFGCVVAKGGRILAEGANEVTAGFDPTAHAEIVAIRRACQTLGDHQLTGCTVVSTCEPCPMCWGALQWARPARLVYACTAGDAAAAGFDDAAYWAEAARPLRARTLPATQLMRDEALAAFRAWEANDARRQY